MGSYQPNYRWYAHPALMLYATAWLIVLLIVGTVAQKSLGLHQAQEIFFSSWFVTVSAIPLPGGRLTLSVITLSLVLKLLRERNWELKMWGVHVVHIGAILLLGGGFLTAMFSTEGHLSILEGQTSGTVQDDHKVELAVIETTDSKSDNVTAYSAGWLKAGEQLTDTAHPFTLQVIGFSKNGEIQQRVSPGPPGAQGMAQRFEWIQRSENPQRERNRAGMMIEASFPDQTSAIYLIVEDSTIDQTVTVGDRDFKLVLRKEQRHLPFAIELIDFERIVYPGTEKPKSFQSTVNVVDENGMKRRAVISMNQPLRFRGYTLYQSSFVQDRIETSVFAVVKNVGRLFPYIASIVMCAGLLLHLIIFLPILMKRRKEEPQTA